MRLNTNGYNLYETAHAFIKGESLEDDLYEHFNTTLSHMEEDLGNMYSDEEIIVYMLDNVLKGEYVLEHLDTDYWIVIKIEE